MMNLVDLLGIEEDGRDLTEELKVMKDVEEKLFSLTGISKTSAHIMIIQDNDDWRRK